MALLWPFSGINLRGALVHKSFIAPSISHSLMLAVSSFAHASAKTTAQAGFWYTHPGTRRGTPMEKMPSAPMRHIDRTMVEERATVAPGTSPPTERSSLAERSVESKSAPASPPCAVGAAHARII